MLLLSIIPLSEETGGGGTLVLPPNPPTILLTLSIDPLAFPPPPPAAARGEDVMRDRLVSKLARPGSGGRLILVRSPRSVVVVCAVALGGGVKLPLPPLPADVPAVADVPLGPSGRGPMGDATVLGVCEPDPDPDCGELVPVLVIVLVNVAVVLSGFCGLVDRGAEIGNPLTSFLPTPPPTPPPTLPPAPAPPLVMAIYAGGPSDRLSFLLPPFLILERKPLVLLPFLVDVKLETDCID